MVDILTVILFVVAIVASLFMAWTIGAGSAGSTPFAPAVGAQAISVMRAGFIVGLCIFLGAVFQGANVSEAVGRELIGGVALTTSAAAVALIIAASLVTIGIFTGYPIATAFTVTGGVIGVGLALGGDPNWPKYIEIALLWIFTPVVGGGISYGISKVLMKKTIEERRVIALLGAIVSILLVNIEFAVLGNESEGATISEVLLSILPGPQILVWTVIALVFGSIGWAIMSHQLHKGLTRGERQFTLVMGAFVAFSAGGSQVGLAVGPLVPLLEGVIPLLTILVGGGIGLLIGAWTSAPRMIKAVSQDYAQLGPRRALAALIPSFAIAQVAILFGIPVSFNQIIVSAVTGAGAAAYSRGGISSRKLGYTILAWIFSFVIAVFVGYVGYSLILIV